jgi:hypothetical protein
MAVGIGLPAWMVYSPQTLTRPTYDVVARNYQHYRIPRPPVAEEGGSPPGQICWGTVGQMPSAEPAPTVGFIVKSEEWQETSRQSQIVRVENPDDPSQYVMEDRPRVVKFTTSPTNAGVAGPNTSTETPDGFGEYDAGQLQGFIPAETAISTKTITMNYKDGAAA